MRWPLRQGRENRNFSTDKEESIAIGKKERKTKVRKYAGEIKMARKEAMRITDMKFQAR